MPKPYGSTVKGKIEHWIKQQKPGYHFRAKVLHRDILKYSVSRSTVNNYLRDFAINGLIKKSTVLVGRNQTWVILRGHNNGSRIIQF